MASAAAATPASPASPPPFGILLTGSKVGYPILSSAFTQVSPTQWVLDLRSLVAGTTAAATTSVEELLQRDLGVRDLTLFLSAPGALPAGAGLALYVAVARSPVETPAWQYRGCVAEGKPSSSFPLAFPSSEGGSDGRRDGAPSTFSSPSSRPPSLLPLSLVPGAASSLSSSSSSSSTTSSAPACSTALVGVSLEPADELASRECASVASRLEFGRRVGLDLFRFAQSFAPAADPAAAAAGAAVLPPGALDAWWRKFEAKFKRDPDFLLRAAARQD